LTGVVALLAASCGKEEGRGSAAQPLPAFEGTWEAAPGSVPNYLERRLVISRSGKDYRVKWASGLKPQAMALRGSSLVPKGGSPFGRVVLTIQGDVLKLTHTKEAAGRKVTQEFDYRRVGAK